MHRRLRITLRTFGTCALAALLALPVRAQDTRGTLSVARFTGDGELIKPTDLDKWVFLGTSMGLGYNAAAPGANSPANSPGQFNVVLMEPNAYAYFKANGKYADGTMFLLSFYGTDQKLSIARSGIVQGDLSNYEIHLLDRSHADGRRFFPFSTQATRSRALPAGNECAQCHLKDGAFAGTFAQFYPAIRNDIPKEALKKALEKGSH
jgi:hypothetical protein